MKVILKNTSVAILAIFVLWGCDGKATEVIACSAEKYLNCPIEKINVEALGAHAYSIKGCGEELEINCKGPADGCSIKSNAEEIKSFPTRACLSEL